mmetsp:Transcript_114811/g.320879  ORF Transcript_114811/g.320879 Transcript_114811/m.320879 type:complete len:229 (+) Transcript_114811:275-961(+)
MNPMLAMPSNFPAGKPLGPTMRPRKEGNKEENATVMSVSRPGAVKSACQETPLLSDNWTFQAGQPSMHLTRKTRPEPERSISTKAAVSEGSRRTEAKPPPPRRVTVPWNRRPEPVVDTLESDLPPMTVSFTTVLRHFSPSPPTKSHNAPAFRPPRPDWEAFMGLGASPQAPEPPPPAMAMTPSRPRRSAHARALASELRRCSSIAASTARRWPSLATPLSRIILEQSM